MPDLLPHRFLFRFAFPVRYVGKLPKRGGKLLDLPPACALADTGRLENLQSFGALRLAWNEAGLGICLDVRGKTRPPRGDPQAPEIADALHVWIDTRATQNIHRASRFCHQFCLLPRGGGRGGNQPAVVQLAIPRAREPTPLCDPADPKIAAEIRSDGYRLEAWLPARALHGYDPEAQPRLGFYYSLRDSELGEQHLTVGAEFPFAYDPSLWSVLELVRDAPVGTKRRTAERPQPAKTASKTGRRPRR